MIMASAIVEPSLGLISTESEVANYTYDPTVTAAKGTESTGAASGLDVFFDPSWSYVDGYLNGSSIDSPTIGILQAEAAGNASAEIFPSDPLRFVASEQLFRLDNQTAVAQMSSVAALSDILTVSGPIPSPTTIRLYLTGFGSVESESQVENGPLPTDGSNGFAYIDLSAQTYQSGNADSQVRLSDWQYHKGRLRFGQRHRRCLPVRRLRGRRGHRPAPHHRDHRAGRSQPGHERRRHDRR